MAISMNWVKEYVNLDDVDLKDLAKKITDSGVNVEHVTSNELNNLVVGEVLECRGSVHHSSRCGSGHRRQ